MSRRRSSELEGRLKLLSERAPSLLPIFYPIEERRLHFRLELAEDKGRDLPMQMERSG